MGNRWMILAAALSVGPGLAAAQGQDGTGAPAGAAGQGSWSGSGAGQSYGEQGTMQGQDDCVQGQDCPGMQGQSGMMHGGMGMQGQPGMMQGEGGMGMQGQGRMGMQGQPGMMQDQGGMGTQGQPGMMQGQGSGPSAMRQGAQSGSGSWNAPGEHRGAVVSGIADDAMAAVQAAQQAIAQGNRQRAIQFLDQGATALRALYVGAPEGQLVQDLDNLQRTLQQSGYTASQQQPAHPQEQLGSGQQYQGGSSDQEQGSSGANAPGSDTQHGSSGVGTSSPTGGTGPSASGPESSEKPPVAEGEQGAGTGLPSVAGPGALTHENQLGAQSNQAQQQLQREQSQQPGSTGTSGGEQSTATSPSGQLSAGSAQPGGTGSSAAGNQAGMQFAPLAADVQRRQVYLDPAVVSGVESARQRAQQGNMSGASQDLQEARSRLVADVALLPIEDAYARVTAARADLEQGDTGTAQRLLSGTPIIITQIRGSAPLVPARFDLRAAAAAAQAGNWNRARQLVSQATQDLQALDQQTSDRSLADQIRPIAAQAQQLQQQMSSGNNPQPQALRDLEQQLGQVQTG